MNVTIVEGDLLDQDVDVIVNAWNRNVIPWWLLIPQGVSGAIKKRGGLQPFRELGRMEAIPLGHAAETSPGKLPFKSIIHLAGINLLWRSSERSIRDSVRNAIPIAQQRGYKSLAIPLIGAGSGGGNPARVQSIIVDELTRCEFDGEVRIVRYSRTTRKMPRVVQLVPKLELGSELKACCVDSGGVRCRRFSLLRVVLV